MTPTLTAGIPGTPQMQPGRVLMAYLREAYFEILRISRAPAFVVPFLVLPAPLYLFFGVMLAGASPQVQANPAAANYIYSGWAIFAVMGPGIFAIGCGLAIERDVGLLRLKRALPAPHGSYLLAKMLMSLAFAAVAVGMVVVAALIAGQITLSPGQLLAHGLVVIAGSLAYCALGLFIGVHASGAAAPAFANLVYLSGLWLSGLFFPLPEILRPWAVIWPAFHLNQVALGAAGVDQFRFMSPAISAAVLIAVTVAFGGLAIRRLARVG